MSNYHVSVLLQEVLEALQPSGGKVFIDGTVGGGGHTKELLQKGARVLGIDQDDDALAYVQETIGKDPELGKNLILVKGNFSKIEEFAKKNGIETVDGVLLDLGVSSHQFDTGERGFSHQKEGNLDMRMDLSLGVTAKDLIHALTEKELAELFERFGEEPFAKRIAKSIVKRRSEREIARTTELADLIKRALPRKDGIHPATLVFQALRIAVNDELYVLTEGLSQIFRILKSGGRVGIISFHSLEDRIVKQTFNEWEDKGKGKILTKKPIIPTSSEQGKNSRSRSAKFRVFEKL